MKNKTITEAELINILKVTEPTFARMRSKLQPKNNENGSVLHRVKRRRMGASFAKEEAYQQECEAQEAASDDGHFDE